MEFFVEFIAWGTGIAAIIVLAVFLVGLLASWGESLSKKGDRDE